MKSTPERRVLVSLNWPSLIVISAFTPVAGKANDDNSRIVTKFPSSYVVCGEVSEKVRSSN